MRKLAILSIIMLLVLSLAACGRPEAPRDEAPDPQMGIVDLKGRHVVLKGIPQRIVSLSPSNTEILFALGAGDKVVGVTSYCDYPEEVVKVERVGDFEGPNMELIRKVQPDAVLAGYIQKEAVTALEGMGIPVMVTEAESFEEIYKSIGLIGEITGTSDKAEEIITGMKEKIEGVKGRTGDEKKPSVFYVVWADPLMTAGSNTFINDVIKLAGGVNVAEKVERWANYSVEEMIKDDPDMLVAALHSTDEGMTKEDLSKSRIFKRLECVKQGKIYVMPDDNIISRPGPRIVQAIEEMNRAFYGE